jgi:hypothetical protein
MPEQSACWRSSSLMVPFCLGLRFSQLRNSSERSPLKSLAALAPPVSRRWFHSSRRTSSRAEVAQAMRWKVSRQTSAPGARSWTTVRIHSAPSQVTNWSFADRSSPRASKNELTVSFVRPFATQITLPVRWSHHPGGGLGISGPKSHGQRRASCTWTLSQATCWPRAA